MKYKIYCGNSLDVLKGMPSESVNTCVTSPPYFGLRQYLFDNAVVLRYNLSTEDRLYVEKELERLGINRRK